MKLNRSKIYLKQAQMMFLDAFIDRANLASRAVGWGLRLLINIVLWTSILQAKGGSIAGFDLKETLSYFIILQIIVSLSFTRGSFTVANAIRYGELSGQLILPQNYLWRVIAMDAGQNMFFFLLQVALSIPFLIFMPELLELNTSLANLLLCLALLPVGFLINVSLSLILGMLAFWFHSSRRIIFIYFSISLIFSGSLIPIAFFPEIVQKILFWTPLPYLYYVPTRILQASSVQLEHLYWTLGSLTSGVVMVSLMFWVYKKGLQSYEANGN